MRDDDHRRVTLVQHLLQPADGVNVEVVGRFIEEQDVRVREQRLRQQHAQLPAGCDRAHRAIVLVHRNADAGQQFAGACLGSIAIVLGELRFEVGGLHVILVGRIRVRVDRVALGHRGPHLGVAHHHHVEHAHLFIRELVLAQLAESLVHVQHHVARRGLEVAAEDLHEGRLAAAVGADQTVAIAIAELDRNVFKQRLGAELHRDIGGGQQKRPLDTRAGNDKTRSDRRAAAVPGRQDGKPAILPLVRGQACGFAVIGIGTRKSLVRRKPAAGRRQRKLG